MPCEGIHSNSTNSWELFLWGLFWVSWKQVRNKLLDCDKLKSYIRFIQASVIKVLRDGHEEKYQKFNLVVWVLNRPECVSGEQREKYI